MWVLDGSGNITITFKTTGYTVLGSLKVEGIKFRSMVDALDQIGKFFFPEALNLSTRKFHITTFSIATGQSTTEFV